MEENFSRRTIEQYLPVLKAIYASFDVQIKTYKDLDKKDRLSFFYMEKELGGSKLLHTGYIIHLWLEGSDFDCDKFCFIKLNENAKWIDFIKLLDKKLDEYKDNQNIIEISLLSNGLIFREINGKQYKHDFKNDGLKTKIISLLSERTDFTKTTEIQKYTESINTKSIYEAVRQINVIMEQNLKLPKKQNLILSKRGSGYKINLFYNIIVVD